MYLNHFNLREKPFSISPDSRFLWLSDKHNEGLSTLKYGIMENKGFLLLTGDIGTGKTLLINAFTKMTGVETLIATIPDPNLEPMDFFNLLSEEFKMGKVFASKGDFLIEFKKFLHESYDSDKKALLIIDEAQRLNHELLEQIRLLSNIEMDSRKLINIFFVGQSEFNQMLWDERSEAIRQRIAVSYQLEPLTERETGEYIHSRLELAGAAKEIFKPNAIREIFSFSSGYPRLINIICDHALMIGYVSELEKIDAAVIKESKKALQIHTDIDVAQNESSNLFENSVREDLTDPRPKPQRSLRYAVPIILMLFFGVTGYQIYGSLTESSLQWDFKDVVPKKENRLLEKQREASKTETGKEEKFKADPPSETMALPAKRETLKTATAPLKEDAVKKGPEPKAGSLKNDYIENPSVAFAGAQGPIIHFEHDSNELPVPAIKTLDSFVKFTAQRPDLKIIVEGYTDTHGDPVYNQDLSKIRAEMVRNYLIGQGIPPAKINAIGRGQENPLKSNETLEGRRYNRRVEIKVNSE